MKKGKKIVLFAGIGVALVAVVVVLILVLGGGHRVIKVDEFEGDVTFERNSEEKDIEDFIYKKYKKMFREGEVFDLLSVNNDNKSKYPYSEIEEYELGAE